MEIVASGSPYLDIDGYAGCVAYAELLRALGREAHAISTSIGNSSITPAVLAWPAQLDDTYAGADNQFVIIDTSSPKHLDKIVELKKVKTVIDHHPGFEHYWQKKLGRRAVIELVGSACTLVYEAWRDAGKLGLMSQTSARLLSCGILDNTLNLQSANTGDRDRRAYQALQAAAALPIGWPEQYFADCERALVKDLPAALKNDLKIWDFGFLPEPLAAAQVAIADAGRFLNSHEAGIGSILAAHSRHWLINAAGITGGKSHFLVSDATVARELEKRLGVRFVQKRAVADRLWLRKEILAIFLKEVEDAN